MKPADTYTAPKPLASVIACIHSLTFACTLYMLLPMQEKEAGGGSPVGRIAARGRPA